MRVQPTITIAYPKWAYDSVLNTVGIVSKWKRHHFLGFPKLSPPQAVPAFSGDSDLAYITSNTDSLTGLGNRHLFFDKLDEILVNQAQGPCSIMVVDLDYFRQMNEIHGRFVGDKVLKQTAELIQQCIASSDSVYRIDDEEFAVILPETPLTHGYWVAERISKKISQHIFYTDAKQGDVHCTVSIGITESQPLTTLSSTELYHQADARLYIAKLSHNQVYYGETE